jgi:hypothetical protein
MSVSGSRPPRPDEAPSDHTALLPPLFDMLREPASGFSRLEFPAPIDWRLRLGEAAPAAVVLKADAALELGPPGVVAMSQVLWTTAPGAVESGLWVAGSLRASPGAPEAQPQRLPFVQLVVLQLTDAEQAADARLTRLLRLTNRVPGYMSRSLSGKSWVRLHRRLAAAGFDLAALGACLQATYREALGDRAAIAVALGAGAGPHLASLDPLCVAAQAVSDGALVRRWSTDGAAACSDLSCTTCDDRLACDVVRAAVAGRGEAA